MIFAFVDKGIVKWFVGHSDNLREYNSHNGQGLLQFTVVSSIELGTGVARVCAVQGSVSACSP